MSEEASPPSVRDSLAHAIASDRQVSREAARDLADRYLAWKATLSNRPVREWEDRLAKRHIDGAWLWEGRPSVVFAGQGKGKSNFAAWAVEKVLETRPTWDIYTTLPFPWDPSCGGPPEAAPGGRIHPVSSLSQVLRGAAESAKAGRVPAVIIDEMDQAVTSHDWMSEEARSWQRLVNIERHLRIRGPLLVYHAYRHVPIVLREGTMLKSMMQVIVKDGLHWVIRREQEGFLNVPVSVIPYLVYGLRGFDIDVDVQDLERHLNGSAEVVREQLLTYLDTQVERARAVEKPTEERRFPPVCGECGQAFSRRDNLNRHLRTVHAGTNAEPD